MAGFEEDNMDKTLFSIRNVQYLLIINGLFFAADITHAQNAPSVDTPALQAIVEDAGQQSVPLQVLPIMMEAQRHQLS
jgi:hypothetical protein